MPYLLYFSKRRKFISSMKKLLFYTGIFAIGISVAWLFYFENIVPFKHENSHEFLNFRKDLTDLKSELSLVKLELDRHVEEQEMENQEKLIAPESKKVDQPKIKMSAADLSPGSKNRHNLYFLPGHHNKHNSHSSSIFNYTAIDEILFLGDDNSRLILYRVLTSYANYSCCVDDSGFIQRYASALYLYGQIISLDEKHLNPELRLKYTQESLNISLKALNLNQSSSTNNLW